MIAYLRLKDKVRIICDCSDHNSIKPIEKLSKRHFINSFDSSENTYCFRRRCSTEDLELSASENL